MKVKGQGLIEFVIVIPVLILLILAIVELGLFWKNAQVVQQIALEAAVVAAHENVSPTASSNSAAAAAAKLVQNRVSSLGLKSLVLSRTVIAGTAPYAAYSYSGGTAPNGKPLITLIVDYRSPIKRGIITQLIYNYRTLFIGIGFTIPGVKPVVIIPRDIPISSTKIQEYSMY